MVRIQLDCLSLNKSLQVNSNAAESVITTTCIMAERLSLWTSYPSLKQKLACNRTVLCPNN